MSSAPLLPGEHINSLLRGGLRIIQNPAAPCFALDAVLLADFAEVRPDETVIDLGSGTGIIALLLAAKQAACRVIGLELIPEMADMAVRSVELNQLQDRVSIITGDIADAAVLLGRARADIVVCNPPYFKPESGKISGDPLFAAARSELHCPLPMLIMEASLLLKPRGRLYMIHRPERLTELLSLLGEAALHVERLRPVQPYADKPANLLLLMARKHGNANLTLLPPLVVYDARDQYSTEMERIYGRDAISGGNADR